MLNRVTVTTTSGANVARVCPMPALTTTVGATPTSNTNTLSSLTSMLNAPAQPSQLFQSINVNVNGVVKSVLIPVSVPNLVQAVQATQAAPARTQVAAMPHQGGVVTASPAASTVVIHAKGATNQSTGILQTQDKSKILLSSKPVPRTSSTQVRNSAAAQVVRPAQVPAKLIPTSSSSVYVGTDGQMYIKVAPPTASATQTVKAVKTSAPVVNTVRLATNVVPQRLTAPVFLKTKMPEAKKRLTLPVGTPGSSAVTPVVIAPDEDSIYSNVMEVTKTEKEEDKPAAIESEDASDFGSFKIDSVYSLSDSSVTSHRPSHVIEIAPIDDTPLSDVTSEPERSDVTRIPARNVVTIPSPESANVIPESEASQSSSSDASDQEKTILEADAIVHDMFQKAKEIKHLKPIKPKPNILRANSKFTQSISVKSAEQIIPSSGECVRKAKTNADSTSSGIKLDLKRPVSLPTPGPPGPPSKTMRFRASEYKIDELQRNNCHVELEKMKLSPDSVINVNDLDDLWKSCPNCPLENAKRSREKLKMRVQPVKPAVDLPASSQSDPTPPGNQNKFFKVKDSSGKTTLFDMSSNPEALKALQEECGSKSKFLLVKTSTNSFLVPMSQVPNRDGCASERLKSITEMMLSGVLPNTSASKTGSATAITSSILRAPVTSPPGPDKPILNPQVTPSRDDAVSDPSSRTQSQEQASADDVEGSETDSADETPNTAPKAGESKEERIKRLKNMLKQQEAKLESLRKSLTLNHSD